MEQVFEFFKKLFDTGYRPLRLYCRQWTGLHRWLYVISDLRRWSACFAIPVVTTMSFFQKNNPQFIWFFFLSGAFILVAGVAHFLDTLTFQIHVYRSYAIERFHTQHELNAEIENRKS